MPADALRLQGGALVSAITGKPVVLKAAAWGAGTKCARAAGAVHASPRSRTCASGKLRTCAAAALECSPPPLPC
jgi:hypothetical protein